MAKNSEFPTNVSKQKIPILLQHPRPTIYSVAVRQGSLTSQQMRKLGSEGIPGIVKETLIDQAVAGLSWEIINPSGERDTQTEYSTLLMEHANDGEGATPFIVRFAEDILTTLQGGYFEVVLSSGGDIPVGLYNVDATTIYATDKIDTPWEQRFGQHEAIYFARNELAHSYWHPVAIVGAEKRNRTPMELAYYYICILAASDDWNMDLLADPFPAGVLSLPGATQEEATAFKESWNYAIRGGDLRDLAVIYGQDLGQAQHVKFTRPPTDMAFEITNHWYTSLVAAAFEMSVLDISVLTKVSTKAGAESQERLSAQQGQRKLRKIIADAIERWILPQGYKFKWLVPKPEDEATLASAAERRARAMFYLNQAFGPERGEEIAHDMGLIPSETGKQRHMEHVKSRVTDLVINSDLRGTMSLWDIENLYDYVLFQIPQPPPDLWGEDLYLWALEQYGRELLTAYDLWLVEVEDDPEIAAAQFQIRYQNALERTATRAYLAGKQRDADDDNAALMIALIGLTILEINHVQDMIQRNREFFKGFRETLQNTGADYAARALWRIGLYGKFLRQFFLEGIVSMADTETDLIEVREGAVETEHCEVCPTRWGQYTVEEYYALDPPPPPPNWCLGHENCHCGIFVLRNGRK